MAHEEVVTTKVRKITLHEADIYSAIRLYIDTMYKPLPSDVVSYRVYQKVSQHSVTGDEDYSTVGEVRIETKID